MEPRVLQHETSGSGEPIVLVPAALTGWLSWIPHAERLAATRRAIRVQPIHNELGSAGQPGDPTYDAETERESLRLTLDDLGIERADFAGWSGGGRAVIEFTLEYPERVRTLTLVEPAAHSLLEELGEQDPGVQRLDDLLNRLAGKSVSEADLAHFLEVAGFGSATEAPSDPNWSRWLTHRMALSWQTRSLDLQRSLREIGGVSCPVLLVKGTETVPWEARVVDVLADELPHARVLELPGDHASHIQSIDAFMEALEEHLRTEVRA